MGEILSNQFAYWAVVVGLFCATMILISSMFFLLKVSVEAFRLAKYKHTFSQLSGLLTEVAIRNETVNPSVALVAKLMVRNIDPSSDMFKKEEAEILRQLNMESPSEHASA